MHQRATEAVASMRDGYAGAAVVGAIAVDSGEDEADDAIAVKRGQ